MAVLVDNLSGTLNLTIGNTFQQESCSTRIIFTDTTTTNNNLYQRWKVEYFLGSTSLGNSDEGGKVIYDFCSNGIFTIVQVVTVYDTDCTTVLYQESSTGDVDVSKVFPELTLPKINCCYAINTEVIITPASLALNNNQCETTPENNAGFFGESSITTPRPIDQVPVVQNGGNVILTSTNHRLSDDAEITISNTSNYNGTYTISNVTSDTFQITAPFVEETPSSLAQLFTTTTSGFAGSFGQFDSIEQILRYKLSYYDLRTGTYLQAQGDVTKGITTSDLNEYQFTFTPDKLTRYKLEASITNCCQTLTREVEFVICDAISIEPSCRGKVECDSCNSYNVYNYTESDIDITVKDLIINKDIHTFTVTANSTISHTFTEDSVYSMTYTTPDSEEEKVIVIANTCDIDKCYTDLLKLQLCNVVSITDCCDDRFLESRLANIQALYQTYLHKIEEFTDLNLRFAQSDLTNRLDDFQRIGKIRDQLLTFCEKCRRHCNSCFEVSNGNCI